MKLLHFSDRENLKVIDPKFMRLSNLHSSWEPINKSFFFLASSPRKSFGSRFENKEAYAANVPLADLYDARKVDPLGFFAEWPRANERVVTKAGFKGVVMTAHGGVETIVLLYKKVPARYVGRTNKNGKLKNI